MYNSETHSRIKIMNIMNLGPNPMPRYILIILMFQYDLTKTQRAYDSACPKSAEMSDYCLQE